MSLVDYESLPALVECMNRVNGAVAKIAFALTPILVPRMNSVILSTKELYTPIFIPELADSIARVLAPENGLGLSENGEASFRYEAPCLRLVVRDSYTKHDGSTGCCWATPDICMVMGGILRLTPWTSQARC